MFYMNDFLFFGSLTDTTPQQSGGAGGSFLSNNTDDDDISVFVQEIDARKPLSGHQRIRSGSRDPTGGSRGDENLKPIAGLLSTDEQDGPGNSNTSGPMLTSESEVDERLRLMNQAFLESLEGLGGVGGGGRRRERRSEDGGSGGSSERGGAFSRERSESRDGYGGNGMGRGRGLVLPRRPRLDSRSTSTSDVGAAVQGSDEVLGRLSLEDDSERQRSSRGQ